MDYYDYYSDYGASSGGGGSTVFSLIMWAAMIIGMWILFMKANEPGWKGIVPFLNVWTLFELAYGAGWKMLLLLVPGLNIVLYFAFWIRLAQSFNVHWAFGIGLALFPNICLLILAFGPWQYSGPATSKFL